MSNTYISYFNDFVYITFALNIDWLSRNLHSKQILQIDRRFAKNKLFLSHK